MALNIPNYSIDERLLKAIKRENLSYFSSKITTNPRLLFTYFYHEGYISENGLYSDIIFPPAKYILTLLGYSVLYGSDIILRYCLDKGADPNASGVVVDCPVLDPSVRWKADLFRMHECKPACLTLPKSSTYSVLLSSSYDPTSETVLRFRLVTPTGNKQRQEAVKGIWELCWIFWKPMRDPQVLLQTTEILIDRGVDIQKILCRINLSQLLRKGFKYTEDSEIHFKNPDHANFALKFIEDLHFSGCQLGFMKLNEHLATVLIILHDYFSKTGANDKCKKIEFLSRGVYYINPKFRDQILSMCEQHQLPEFINSLLSLPVLTLKNICMMRLRNIIGSKHFVGKVAKLPKLSEEDRTRIIRGF